ncbi:MAG TPA: hypothetical protein VLW55_12100 [Burkholderiaceae bacterium]|nr:hypothetical protein [Burkholderiaceae bacterium]
MGTLACKTRKAIEAVAHEVGFEDAAGQRGEIVFRAPEPTSPPFTMHVNPNLQGALSPWSSRSRSRESGTHSRSISFAMFGVAAAMQL